MPDFNRVVSIIEKEGFGPFFSTSLHYMRNKLKGGYSNRERVEAVSGLLRPAFSQWFNYRYHAGDQVMGKDWDTLVILDACRFDTFQDVNDLDGTLSKSISCGADSPRFLDGNFRNETFHDTVYVTANPHVSRLGEDVFFYVDDAPVSNWDSELQCVPPEVVTDAAKSAHESYPNKRLIVHYMQPHDPPIGPIGQAIREEMDIAGPTPESANTDTGERIMRAVSRGEVSVERAMRAYEETLQVVLEETDELARAVDGKTVVTADHGEHFGEKYPILGKLYEHFRHPRTPELCVVPWFTVDDGCERRRVTEDEPVGSDRISQSDVADQLEALGYK